MIGRCITGSGHWCHMNGEIHAVAGLPHIIKGQCMVCGNSTVIQITATSCIVGHRQGMFCFLKQLAKSFSLVFSFYKFEQTLAQQITFLQTHIYIHTTHTRRQSVRHHFEGTF